MKASLVILSVLVSLASFGCGQSSSEESNSTECYPPYAPWGIDEYELFGLTKDELSRDFAGRLKLVQNGREVIFSDSSHNVFRLTYEDGKVAAVQRVLIDGAGCHIEGPPLSCKHCALEFAINGLSSGGYLSIRDQHKLAMAREALDAYERQSSETPKEEASSDSEGKSQDAAKAP